MKRATIVLLLVVSACVVMAQAEKPSLRLEISPSQQTLRLGQQMQVQLKITGQDLNRVVEGAGGPTLTLGQTPGFTCNATFEPDTEGVLALGPYSLTFNGIALQSNVLTIQVLPEIGDVVGTFFRVDRTEITQGESFELVVETRTKTEGSLAQQTPPMMPKVQMKRDRNHSYNLSVGPMKMTVSTQGKTRARVSLTTLVYGVSPKESGPFYIRKDMFKNFPEDCNDPNITVIVHPAGEPFTD